MWFENFLQDLHSVVADRIQLGPFPILRQLLLDRLGLSGHQPLQFA
jgi:hypothetical protein